MTARTAASPKTQMMQIGARVIVRYSQSVFLKAPRRAAVNSLVGQRNIFSDLAAVLDGPADTLPIFRLPRITSLAGVSSIGAVILRLDRGSDYVRDRHAAPIMVSKPESAARAKHRPRESLVSRPWGGLYDWDTTAGHSLDGCDDFEDGITPARPEIQSQCLRAVTKASKRFSHETLGDSLCSTRRRGGER